MGKFKDLTGQKFGRLIVISIQPRNNKREKIKWICNCDCGNKNINIRGSDLITGKIQSCGCLRIESITKHGKYNTKLYKVFQNMKSRCLNKNNPTYTYYGDRNIKICSKWLDVENGFINFYNWAIDNGYHEGLSLDRIDNNGNYSPENCRFVTKKEQSRNTRNNVYLTFNGKTQLKSDWCNELNIVNKTLDYRLNKYNIKTEPEKIFNKKITKNLNKKSGIIGITWSKKDNRWVVQRVINGIRYYIGRFKNLNDAKLNMEIFLKNFCEKLS